ncbi:hypothetical protein N5079_15755 [Planotetraspora sp. A-T 1434]|uniref:hypothetical protein n=1 Tax=Planotetraspora sp. A-T 1434 TaxID=2979219 RepID=UPI0021C058DF|nr:hypothetical protein [Planotetraspora sp. A-T 1434]MCT9931669.1 hypothetical protein [Planotetraspora sp. A-T 1434]
MHVAPGVEYQATTTQVCGLYPFVAGAGAPSVGTPIGRHQLSGEVVCLDPLTWLRAGLVTNPGVFVLGQPGTGKSTLVKRLVVGAVAFGSTALILGDTKPDYTPLVAHLGGQVIGVGRGMDRLNPLDAGPLAAALRQMSGPEAQRLRWEVRGRRLSLLLALCTLIRESRITNFEEVVLGRAVDLLDERLPREPTVPDVLAVIEEGPEALRSAARADTDGTYRGKNTGPGVHPRPAVHGVAGRGVRRADHPPAGSGRAGGRHRHLPDRYGRRQAAERRDAVHLGVLLRNGGRLRGVE